MYKIKTLVNLGKNGITVQVPQQQSNDIITAQISHNNQEQIPPQTKKRYGNFHFITQCNFDREHANAVIYIHFIEVTYPFK